MMTNRDGFSGAELAFASSNQRSVRRHPDRGAPYHRGKAMMLVHPHASRFEVFGLSKAILGHTSKHKLKRLREALKWVTAPPRPIADGYGEQALSFEDTAKGGFGSKAKSKATLFALLIHNSVPT